MYHVVWDVPLMCGIVSAMLLPHKLMQWQVLAASAWFWFLVFVVWRAVGVRTNDDKLVSSVVRVLHHSTNVYLCCFASPQTAVTYIFCSYVWMTLFDRWALRTKSLKVNVAEAVHHFATIALVAASARFDAEAYGVVVMRVFAVTSLPLNMRTVLKGVNAPSWLKVINDNTFIILWFGYRMYSLIQFCEYTWAHVAEFTVYPFICMAVLTAINVSWSLVIYWTVLESYCR
jgi:hypothetical protein